MQIIILTFLLGKNLTTLCILHDYIHRRSDYRTAGKKTQYEDVTFLNFSKKDSIFD